jgi:hypothetical protein
MRLTGLTLVTLAKLDGGRRRRAVENTKDVTTFGGEGVRAIEYPAKAGYSPTSAQTAKSVTKNGVPLGSQEERLEILQQSALNYQKAGGQVRVGYSVQHDALVIVLATTGICASCGNWIFGNGNGCQKCAKEQK